MSPLLIALLAGACLALIPAAPAGATDPIGSQFRVSFMGPDGDANYDAFDPKVAYNSQANEYLVVWEATDSSLFPNDNEIFAQRVDASGGLLGPRVRVSDMGPDTSAAFDAVDPGVTYNSQTNEYLVVWEGEDGTPPLVDGEDEIYVQRLSSLGVEVGANDVRVSDMGPDGNANFDALDPAVAYGSQQNEYVVVWEGDDNTPPLVDNENEIYGQRVSADGSEVGSNDFRISDVGPDGNGAFDALDPAIAYAPDADEFLVTWEGDDDVAPLVDNENEVLAQRISAAGAELGASDFRVSDAGPNGNTTYSAGESSVAYNTQTDEYLVAFVGDDDTPPQINDELETFVQRLSIGGGEVGTNDQRISDAGPDGNATYDAVNPSVVYNHRANEYLVGWQADDDTPPVVNDEIEIYGQRLDPAAVEIGSNDFRISAMGPDGNANIDATETTLAYGSGPNEYLVAWQGEDITPPLVNEEFEIFARRSGAGPAIVPPAPPAEPAPPAPPAETPPASNSPPPPAAKRRRRQLLLVGAPARQRLLKRRKLVLLARCNPSCVISIKARLRTRGSRATIGHRPLAFRLGHDLRHRISLRLSRAWLKRLRRSSGHGQVIVDVTVKGVREAPAFSAVVNGA